MGVVTSGWNSVAQVRHLRAGDRDTAMAAHFKAFLKVSGPTWSATWEAPVPSEIIESATANADAEMSE